MTYTLAKIKAHKFTKELKNCEYEIKFDVVKNYRDSLDVLKEAEKHFKNHSRFILCKFNGGDRLVTEVIFYSTEKAEYSLFEYKGIRMIKVKKHKILSGWPFEIFKNFEELLIDKKDYSNSGKLVRQRLHRHKHRLVNLEKSLTRLGLITRSYIGKMIKERVKDFILDSRDGRIYSVAVAFCRCQGKTQKQLEVEYAGYLPGFHERRFNNEKQILNNLTALTRYIHKCMHKILRPSVERKFEFVRSLS